MKPETEESACLYVLDRLDATERAWFEARLASEPDLAAFVGELESTLSRHLRTPAAADPPPTLLAGIDARIDLLARERMREHARAPWASIARWGIAAAITASVGIIAVQQVRRGAAPGRPYVIIVGMDSGRSTLAELPLQDRARDPDGSFIQLASLAERLWESPDGLPEKLRFAGPRSHGYALFDPASSQGFVAIQRLPATGLGKRYHLWIVDTASGRTHEAGILPLAVSGSGLYFFTVAPALDARPDHLDFFVTLEDTAPSGPVRPSGKVVLGDGRVF